MDSSHRDTAPFPARLDNQASSTCRCYNFMGKTSFLVRKTTVITVADEPPAQMKKEPLAGVSGTGAKPLQEKEKRPWRHVRKSIFQKTVKRHSINQCQPNEVWYYKSKEIKFFKLHGIWPQSEKGQTTSKMPRERQPFITQRSLAYVADRWIFHLKPWNRRHQNPSSTSVSDLPGCSEQGYNLPPLLISLGWEFPIPGVVFFKTPPGYCDVPPATPIEH